MDNKTTALIVSFLSMAASPQVLWALELAEVPVTTVELGVGLIDDDAYKFGRYTGLEQDGGYLIGNVDAQNMGEDGRYWRARINDLGLDSRYLRLEGGFQGRHEYYLEYDQLPNNKSNTGRTPFLQPGSAGLSLPAGFDITTNLNSALQPMEIETERRRLGLGASLLPNAHWKFKVDYRHETKEGIDRIGGVMGGTFPNLLNNTTAALLPEPIDYTTDDLNLTMNYERGKAQFQLGYHFSMFDNANHALTWEDPFSTGDFGSQALEPDNEFHQVSAQAGYLLPHNSRVTGMLSLGRMTQNQDFQAYSIQSGLGGTLPRASLEGEVWLINARAALSSNPLPKLRLNAAYRYSERDNDTPVATYDYILADSFDPAASVTNRPMSYKKNEIDVTAKYRINSDMNLKGGYRFDGMKRDYTNVEREDTDEHTLFAKWKVRARDNVNLTFSAEASKRDGDSYTPLAVENTALRKFYLADRDRNKVGASVDYSPTDRLGLTLSADYIKDDYNNSIIGLTEASEPTYTVDVSYQPRSNITTYAFYTREDIDSMQAGSAAGTATPDWTADVEDSVDTLGIGARINKIRSKMDVGADLVFSKTTGKISLTDLSAPGTEDQFPDLQTDLVSLKLWGSYQYRKDMTLKLSYWYEDYSADNWALDGLDEDDVGNMLLLGEDTLDYSVNFIALSVLYRFE